MLKKQFKTFDLNQNYKNENTETKNSLYDWLISYISEIVKKQQERNSA